MDKTAIRNYAIWARKALLEGVKQKAYAYGITERTVTSDTGGASPDAEGAAVTADGRMLTAVEKSQRAELLREIRRKGYAQVMEEAAYTWFNRFIALRFMEVNRYLPSQVRVFTDGSGQFHPDILQEAMTVEIPGLDREKVLDYLDRQDNEGLYQYLLLTQCNALHEMLPLMFETIDSYTELLFPVGLLQEGSVLSHLVTDIPEADWDVQTLDESGTPQGQVEIIGWLYQYYNTELKEDTFAKLKKNVKISRERIPCATQLFTPDWIVRYMVENSLGRLWIEGHPEDANLKENWKYYLEEAEQEPEVEAQLAAIRAEYRTLRPQDIRLVDPCMGSGHILVYAFEVLMQIYVSQGYAPRDAAQSILENNLYGLDIDDRAAQLAYFAVMMKARQYDRRILTRKVQPHVYAIAESNGIILSDRDRVKLGPKRAIAEKLLKELHDAKEYGSILKLSLPLEDLRTLHRRLQTLAETVGEGDLLERAETMKLCDELLPLVEVAEVLVQTYHVVVTNPPYAGASGLNGRLNDFLKKEYPETSHDLFAAFIEKCICLTALHGQTAMITQQAWMFLSSYEKLRANIYAQTVIETMAHLGNGAFGMADFGLTTFALLKASSLGDYAGQYDRLVQENDPTWKETAFLSGENHHTAKQSNFSKIPGSPVAYWLSKSIIDLYDAGNTMESVAHPKVGMQTSNNEKYLRLWHEINYSDFEGSSAKRIWIKYLKGGPYRKWYGNLDYLLHYNGTPEYILQQENARVLDQSFLSKVKCTWTDLTSGKNSFRLAPKDTFYDISGHCFFPNTGDQYWLLAYANSKIFSKLKIVFNSTFHCQVGDVAKIVVPNLTSDEKETISLLSAQCVQLSRTDWDSYETSWDFKRHPMV